MMHRPMSLADSIASSGFYGGADIILGFADGFLDTSAFGHEAGLFTRKTTRRRVYLVLSGAYDRAFFHGWHWQYCWSGYGNLLWWAGSALLDVALRFVLSCPKIHTAIQATSNIKHLEYNIALSDVAGLPDEIKAKVRECYHAAIKKEGRI